MLHLFALATLHLAGDVRTSARNKVQTYLKQHLGLAEVGIYMAIYQDLIEAHEEDDLDWVMTLASQMARKLGELLRGDQKYIALIQFLEIVILSPKDDVPDRMAVALVNDLGLPVETGDRIRRFMADPVRTVQTDRMGRILEGESVRPFQGRIAALDLPDSRLFIICNMGPAPVRLEAYPLLPGEIHVLRPGQALRDNPGNELYFSHFTSAFSEKSRSAQPVALTVSHLTYRFPGGGYGLQDFSCQEKGGRMIGIMGGSGAGKSTLLSLLNGTLHPTSGAVTLNGHDLHKSPVACDGLIGHIPQDDLLFDDLTVFQNLYYAGRLCLAHLGKAELSERVHTLLDELGQSHIADLKVGSPLQKTISGGQRKRLNIALELIREPGLLFVDEPTSGLSSTDAENVMGLLREQAAQNRLVIVVIHQPSSRIFRMFDALWILDQGGLPVFTGTPLEAIAYFRSRGGLPGAEECICPGCGDVNPAQIFEILESKTIDTDGEFTRQRRILPKQWRDYFLQYEAKRQARNVELVSQSDNPVHEPETERPIHRPGLLGQLKVFFLRDLHARLSNRPYLLITLLEPPLLGLIIGLVTRGKIFERYSFHTNENLHIFFFLSVIVAIFLGLSISAEEICRDRKILKRERFLGLSWFSYINSKCLYLGIVAMIQMLLYIGVANAFLGLPHMHVKMWLVLAVSAFGISILGLNISSAFRSAVTIYILIPIILIPQMLLSGAVIRFEGLISSRSVEQEVPVFADIFFSRWGYEALIVEQYAGNPHMQELVETDATIRLAEYELDHVIPELKGQIASILWFQQNDPKNTDIEMKRQAIKHEVSRLERQTGQSVGVPAENFQAGRFTQSDADQIEKALIRYRRSVFEKRRKASGERRLVENRIRQELGIDGLEQRKKKYTNQGIERLVLKTDEMESIRLSESGLVRKTLPIYRKPESRMGRAHFLAREKCLGNLSISTYPFNLGVILLMGLLCYILLYFDVFSRLTISTNKAKG